MSGTLRVALLGPSDDPAVRDFIDGLAAGLRERGQSPSPIGHGVWSKLEDQLRRRMFEENLTSVPAACLALGRGEFDLAHAAHPAAALAASLWALQARRPVVFTYLRVASREELAARRLRLGTLEQALERADAVVVESEEAAEALRRWLGVEPRVIAPGPGLAESYERLYGELL